MKGFWQIVITLCFLFVLGMLWWSSNSIEADLKAIRRDLLEMKKERLNAASVIYSTANQPQVLATVRPWIDPSLPNLLTEDPYMEKVLPSLISNHLSPKGVLREAMLGRPEHLHPFNGFRDVAKFYHLCVPSLARSHVGKSEEFAPDLAIKIEQRPREGFPGNYEYWVHLREVHWHPLNPAHFPDDIQLAAYFFESHPVTAYDFRFYYDTIMNSYISDAKAMALRDHFAEIENFIIKDPLTFVIQWKQVPDEEGVLHTKYAAWNLTAGMMPLPCFVFQHFADGDKIIEDDMDPTVYQRDMVFAQNFSNHWSKNVIASCGAYQFNGFGLDGIRFTRNPAHYYPLAVLVEGYEISFKEGLDAVWQAFKTDAIDLCYLHPTQFAELDRYLDSSAYAHQNHIGSEVRILDYTEQSFYYIGWNLHNPLFSSRVVRQALTQSIDLQRLLVHHLNHMAMPLSGPFSPFSPAYDPQVSLWSFYPDHAKYLLEQEGWVDQDGDGIREKVVHGIRTPFRFRLCYFVKSLSTKAMVEYFSIAFRAVGIDCIPCGLDITDLSRQFDEKAFDAILLGWQLASPPEDPYQIWHSSGAYEKGSSNAIGFANLRADWLIEHLNFETNREKRMQYYHEFHRIIHEEAPYTFLYTPKLRLLYRNRVKNIFIPIDHPEWMDGATEGTPYLGSVWIAA